MSNFVYDIIRDVYTCINYIHFNFDLRQKQELHDFFQELVSAYKDTWRKIQFLIPKTNK